MVDSTNIGLSQCMAIFNFSDENEIQSVRTGSTCVQWIVDLLLLNNILIVQLIKYLLLERRKKNY